jgi:DNA-binding MarR family transcriptional regulator
MIDRKNQIEGILQSFQATKQMFFKTTHIISNRKQLPHSQWMVLHIIYHNEGIGIKELSRIMGVSSSAATQLVDNLIKKEMLVCEKNPDDRRALNIRIVKNIKKLIETARTRTLEQIYSIFDVLSDDELQQYCQLSKKVANHILEKPRR